MDLEAHPVIIGSAAALIVGGTLLLVSRTLRRAAVKRAGCSLEERLRFERLLSETSAELIHVASRDLSVALQRALQQVAEFLGVERGSVDEYAGGVPTRRISWALPGFEEPPQLLDTGQFPWAAEKLRRREVVRFSRLDELPEEAAVDRTSFGGVGTRSKVSLPLRAGGAMLGVLSFGSVRGERAWPDELVERLRLLSEVFANALERKRIENSLAERLRFEKLLASLSVTFGHLSPVDFDRGIQRALDQVVDFLGVDRGSLIEFSRDGGTARSWAIEEWINVGGFPWMTAQLRRGDHVSVSHLEELPDEAAVDRRSYLVHRVKPQVAVPLLAGETVVGGLVFSRVGAERAKSAELMQQLRLVAEVFAHALSRKQGELETQRLMQDLTHIGRVSAMGELAASLAHELNQPLTAILSNAQTAEKVLAGEPVDLQQLREIVSDIIADDKRAGDVIGRVRGLVKKGDFEQVSLDLNEVVREVVWLVRNDAVIRKVTMSLELAADLPPVRGDRVQLQQVVLNLVLNGMEAMQEPSAADRILVIRTGRDGSAGVRVSIRDSGSGIDEEDRDYIFQPLYTTKAAGLGMGLAISRTIVESHGGKLEAENNLDAGVTVQFNLPVETQAAA